MAAETWSCGIWVYLSTSCVEKQVEEAFMSDGNPAPFFARQPGRIMEYTPAGKRIRVIFDGVIIGDTQAAIALQDANYPVG